MKKIEEIIEELKQWEKEGKGRGVAVAAVEMEKNDAYGNISGCGLEVVAAIACILKNAEDCGIPLQMITSYYEEMKETIVKRGKQMENGRYS